ncbi:DUF2188 domain-containing protein [Spirosoma utsteinense]|uniref:hypothetical protein n=1 Tax=Spirosoma utsteinense TaxID=2585773 RepID=UPI001ED4D908|nr:hypothetical protein [Spirosoma utsteinense]MBC3784756.1 putative protein YdaT [Spirosoma utsteinense]
MRSLNPQTRAKAIEIANDLMRQGEQDKQTAIANSIREARTQARREYAEATDHLFSKKPCATD